MIRIVQFCSRDTNPYGNWSSVHVLQKHLGWRGIDAKIIDHSPSDDTDLGSEDIFLGDGGQDVGQDEIQEDLQRHIDELGCLVEGDTPTPLICDMYQLPGRTFVTDERKIIKGAGILPLDTCVGTDRPIGNITLETPESRKVVGYENHSGRTYVDDGHEPLRRVLWGTGNNGEDQQERLRYRNIVGTYLYNPILSTNPRAANFLITKALERRDTPTDLASLPVGEIAAKAYHTARSRPHRDPRGEVEPTGQALIPCHAGFPSPDGIANRGAPRP